MRTLVYCVVKNSRPPDLKSSSNVSLPFVWITGPATDPSSSQSMLICIMNTPFAGRKILRGAVAAAGSSVRWPKFFSRNVCEEFLSIQNKWDIFSNFVNFSKYANVYYEWPFAGRKIQQGAVAAASSSVRWPKFFSQCLRRISWPWISFLGSHQIELFVRMLHPFALYASKWGQIYFQFALGLIFHMVINNPKDLIF